MFLNRIHILEKKRFLQFKKKPDPVRVEKTDNEMIMQRLYQQYGKHLVLLYTTYKTSKYSFKLHFLVAKTNVNCQVAAAIVT